MCLVLWQEEEWETTRCEWQLKILERYPEYKICLWQGKKQVHVPMGEIRFNGQKETGENIHANV